MNLFLNLEDKKYIELVLVDNEKIIESGSYKNFTELFSKIYDYTKNNEITGYTISKYDKNLTVKLNGIFNFKKDKKMLLGDIKQVKKS